jgi:membrane-bound serine protease (ClpP class)
MTLIAALLVVGAVLLVAEAHLASYGVLGVTGTLALVAGFALAIGAAGASTPLAVALTLPVALGLLAFVAIATRKALAVRRRRPRSGAAALIGRVGVVRRAPAPLGAVLVEGELWRARPSWDDEPVLHEGEYVVVERVHGLTLGVRRAEEWEVLS